MFGISRAQYVCHDNLGFSLFHFAWKNRTVVISACHEHARRNKQQTNKQTDKGLVSKETVVLRRWGSENECFVSSTELISDGGQITLITNSVDKTKNS